MAKVLDAEVLGSEAVRKELDRLGKAYPEAMARALYQQGVQVWSEAVRRAPVEFAVLRTSGYAAPPVKDGEGHTYVEVGFGTHYAVYQHENGNLRHPRGGEDHYLQKAVEATVSIDKIAAWTRENVEKGLGVKALRPGAPKSPRVDEGRRKRAVLRKKRRAEKRKQRRKAGKKPQRRGGSKTPTKPMRRRKKKGRGEA
jgi:hypothetical protein